MSTVPVRRAAVPPRTAGPDEVALGLLQGFRLERNGGALELPLGIQRLVAFLAVHNRPLLRVFVAGNLWIDSTDEHAQANLRTALWRLRGLGFRLVVATRNHLSLAPGVVVDVHELTARAREVLRHETPPVRGDIDAILLGGELLPDWYDDWVLLEREQFRQLRLLALETLCRDLTATGAYAGAVEAGLACLAAEPLRESAHRALIDAHLAEGNRGEAIRQFRLYRTLAHDELGIGPSVELQRMFEPLLNGDGRMTRAH